MDQYKKLFGKGQRTLQRPTWLVTKPRKHAPETYAPQGVAPHQCLKRT